MFWNKIMNKRQNKENKRKRRKVGEEGMQREG
jgi:hypothetical protein